MLRLWATKRLDMRTLGLEYMMTDYARWLKLMTYATWAFLIDSLTG